MIPGAFRPSRQYRRRFAGRPCPGCGNRVDAADLVAFAPGTGRTYYLHATCLDVMQEAAAASSPEEETGEATAAGPMVHDVPSTEETP